MKKSLVQQPSELQGARTLATILQDSKFVERITRSAWFRAAEDCTWMSALRHTTDAQLLTVVATGSGHEEATESYKMYKAQVADLLLRLAVYSPQLDYAGSQLQTLLDLLQPWLDGEADFAAV